MLHNENEELRVPIVVNGYAPTFAAASLMAFKKVDLPADGLPTHANKMPFCPHNKVLSFRSFRFMTKKPKPKLKSEREKGEKEAQRRKSNINTALPK